MKEGYKQTELDIIPEDWEIKKLGNLGIFFKGKGVPKSEITNDGCNCLTYGDLYTKYNIVIKNVKSFITQEIAELSQEIVYGDICFAASGETLEDIGKSAVYLESTPGYAGGDIIVFRGNQNALTLAYFLNSDGIKSQMYKFGQGHSVVHIYKSQIENLKIPIPPIEEQNAIANCLSTWDEAIEKQQKLIEAKEIRHKALMQKLLSGKKRLPGFSDEWKEVKLGDLFEFKKGSGLSKDLLTESGQPCILYGELFTKYREVISEVLSFTESSTNVVSKAGDILLPGSTTTTGIDLAKASVILKSNVYLGGDINILRPKAILNSTFVSYLLNYEYKYEISAMAQGITIIHLYGKDLKHIKISIPATQEQDNIVEILEYSINEILIEKKKVDQLKEQKKALMQKLLTGKVRLPLQN
ncbi:restriction endonuclease subunit S [Empedobacter stercoris]|uniref:restriction endonuclease subunit S n=1 Tax=Empedobacter stercoris TaxID=1628248 RepID=UPI0039E7F430